MNKTIELMFAAAFAAYGAFALPLTFTFENDRPGAVYRCGEEAVFTVTACGTNGTKATSGVVTAVLNNFGPKVVATREIDLAKENPFVLRGSLAEPGFLKLELSAPDTPSRCWSVGFDPERIVKGSPSPADFDAFWSAARAKLAREVPADVRMERMPERSAAAYDFYRISFATFGRRVHGYMSVPTDKSLAPYPVSFCVAAAGFGGWTNTMAPSGRAICVFFSVYPFEPTYDWEKPEEKAKYDAMNAASHRACGTGYSQAGMATGREDYFFYPVILGIDRAVDWVAARKDVDLSRFHYFGTSQGGGFGFYLTGLNSHFTKAAFFVPAITDTLGYLAGRASGWPRVVESQKPENKSAAERNAPYFDGANFAARIRCPVRVVVGFSDTTCPPCAVYAAYNAIPAADKGILHGLGMTHSVRPDLYKRLMDWLDCDLARHADLFTGTAATGHTHPSASYPFGMVQAGPDTGDGTWPYCSGYQFADKSVLGYSQTHLSGTGCPDYGDVQLLPFSGPVRPLPMQSAIDKASEKASPGYYAVRQPDDGVAVEIAAARRAAIYRLTWDGRDGEAKVLVNLPFGHNCGKQGWGRMRSWQPEIAEEDGRLLVGSYRRTGWAGDRKVAFALAFDRPWKSLEKLPATGKDDGAPRYVATFAVKPGETMLMKVALSPTSGAAAKRNLADSIPDWNFDQVRAAARTRWNDLFARTTCRGTSEQLGNWYTALYHLYLQPNDWSDAGKEPDFTTLSLWDTFRASHPWYTIATPEIVGPTIRSMTRIWRSSGALPVMSYGLNPVCCMIGNHSVPVIADAYLKGFRCFDVDEMFAAVTNTLTVTHPGKPKENWDQYSKYGYFPLDLNKGEGASRTLECAYDDACAARLFEALGRPAAAAEYGRRSRNWRNVFDPSVGFARGRDTKGGWREPFNPFHLAHENDWPSDFTEGNAWQYTWHVMHDPEGLIAALGGKERFAAKLDALFKQPSRVEGQGFVGDVSGLIGQYAHGNEPSHHVIYFFQYADRPDLAAHYIRKVFDTQYHLGPEGLCGNDDCGQMSAWYVFSAAGFYPFDPCGAGYVIGAPQVPQATFNLPGGAVFTVKANGLSEKAKYVKAVRLDGRPLKGFILKHADILAGGTLEFDMTEETK